MTKPKVGDVVHFYAPSWAHRAQQQGLSGPGYNGQGEGPYAAIVTQFFDAADYVNLKVFVPFAAPVDMGSVPTKGGQHYHEGGNYWLDPRGEAARDSRTAGEVSGLTEEQIAHMRDRFLSWRLPDNFNPDCGIHFDAEAAMKLDPRNLRYEPNGTNLLDATQAHAMVRHMVEGLPQ